MPGCRQKSSAATPRIGWRGTGGAALCRRSRSAGVATGETPDIFRTCRRICTAAVHGLGSKAVASWKRRPLATAGKSVATAVSQQPGQFSEYFSQTSSKLSWEGAKPSQANGLHRAGTTVLRQSWDGTLDASPNSLRWCRWVRRQAWSVTLASPDVDSDAGHQVRTCAFRERSTARTAAAPVTRSAAAWSRHR